MSFNKSRVLYNEDVMNARQWKNVGRRMMKTNGWIMDKKTELGVNGSQNGQWKRLPLATAKSKTLRQEESQPGSVPQPV